jgi:hypothetical protein
MEAIPLLDGFDGSREGELAARTIGAVIRQEYGPALRVARYICFMAEGRATEWEAWQQTLRGFANSMFQHSYIELGDQIGLEEANIKIRAFAKAFIPSFERDIDAVVAGTLKATFLDEPDQARMRDWLRLLEKSDRALNPVLASMYGQPPRKGLFERFRLDQAAGEVPVAVLRDVDVVAQQVRVGVRHEHAALARGGPTPWPAA